MTAALSGVTATQPTSTSAWHVDPAALIVVGSSTYPDGTGNENFFGGAFNQAPYNPGGQPGPGLITVHFSSGTAGIEEALQSVSGADNAVLSSGWGAANTALVLSRLDRRDDPVLPSTLFVLDNNVSRPDGGFGTRYPLFALIGVNPFPARTDTTAAGVVDVAYQYNYNSNAPADLLNVVAHVNALVAYLYGYREQDQVDLPVDVDGNPSVSCAGANTCAVLADGTDVLACDDARCAAPPGDRIAAYVTTRGNTTYVTYTTDELPLARLIRDVVPFGDAIADLTEPLLRLMVDSAYYDGNPIPSDPSRYRPARLMPTLPELVATIAQVPGAIAEGLGSLAARTSRGTLPEPDRGTPDVPSAATDEDPVVDAEDPREQPAPTADGPEPATNDAVADEITVDEGDLDEGAANEGALEEGALEDTAPDDAVDDAALDASALDDAVELDSEDRDGQSADGTEVTDDGDTEDGVTDDEDDDEDGRTTSDDDPHDSDADREPGGPADESHS